MATRRNAIGGFVVTVFVIAATLLAAPATAATIFTETFNYTVGTNLAGQNGGSGFSGAWSGGDSTIVAGLGGTGNAVQIGSSIASRPLSATTSTSGTSIYLTYIMNSSNFSGGNYTGISLWNGGTEEMFLGIPYQAQKFGFDAHAGNGPADIRSVDFTPAANLSYLIAVGLMPSATSGKVDVKMWATSNLAVNPDTLVAGAPNASLLGVKNNFSFNTLKVNGDYAGSLKVAGIASSPNVSEAAAVTVATVPEPSTLALAGLGVVVAAALSRKKNGAAGTRTQDQRIKSPML